MAKLLTEAELQEIRDGRPSTSWLVCDVFIGTLLDHIEAQEEALGHARETARLLIRATEQLEQAQVEVAVLRLAPTTTDHATAGQVPLDALAPLGLVSSEWKVLTEIDYLRADVQHLQDVAEAAEQLYQAFHKPSMVRWEDTVKLWMSCLHEALRQAGYLREKADAE